MSDSQQIDDQSAEYFHYGIGWDEIKPPFYFEGKRLAKHMRGLSSNVSDDIRELEKRLRDVDLAETTASKYVTGFLLADAILRLRKRRYF